MTYKDDICPNGCNLRGTEIRPEFLAKGYYGAWDGFEKRYYSRQIGIETPSYDGVSEWLCPDCGVRWSRFTGEILK